MLTATLPGPRHEVGTFKVERHNPDRYRLERFRLRLLEFNLELHRAVVKGTDSTATQSKNLNKSIKMFLQRVARTNRTKTCGPNATQPPSKQAESNLRLGKAPATKTPVRLAGRPVDMSIIPSSTNFHLARPQGT